MPYCFFIYLHSDIIQLKGKAIMDRVTYYHFEQLEIIHLRNKPLSYNEHNHVSVYTIGLVLDGQITLKCDKKKLVCPANSFFVVAPYQVHALLLSDAYEMISICIHKDTIKKQKPTEVFNTISIALQQLSLTNINDTLLETAIIALYGSNTSQSMDGAILSSANSLNYSPQDHRNLKKMAAEVCYSQYHYIKRFKQQVGITPHKFQLQNRVRKAQRMIESGKNSTTIAFDLGFYDQSHFIKCFKSIVGLTPSEYKKSVRKIELT